MHKALFLDRDGVLIESVADYVLSWKRARPIIGAIRATAKASLSGYLIVIVTNQSPIGRGLASRDAIDEINQEIVKLIEAEGGQVAGVYVCPHRPDELCECRKPRPGMLLEAAAELDIDLSRSMMVGDALTDAAAGENAGVMSSVLVRTGRGEAQERLAHTGAGSRLAVFDSLHAAVETLLTVRED